MQIKGFSKNVLFNVRWEVRANECFSCYEVVTSKSFYGPGQLNKDNTPRKNAKSKKLVIAQCTYKTFADHIADAHNAYIGG